MSVELCSPPEPGPTGASAAITPFQRARAHADAEALFAATAMLLDEGREKGFHFFALHLRVALMELEDQIATLADQKPLPRPARARKRPRVSAAMQRLIRDAQD